MPMRFNLILIALINIHFLNAKSNDIQELPIGLTQDEKNNIDLIYDMGRDTDPPAPPVRNIAEFERMSGVLIRYPLGVSLDIIQEIAEDITIYCLVSTSQQNNAFNSFSNFDINMLKLSKNQKIVMDFLHSEKKSVLASTIKDVVPNPYYTINALEKKQLIKITIEMLLGIF